MNADKTKIFLWTFPSNSAFFLSALIREVRGFIAFFCERRKAFHSNRFKTRLITARRWKTPGEPVNYPEFVRDGPKADPDTRFRRT
jgi:hypothetical protein